MKKVIIVCLGFCFSFFLNAQNIDQLIEGKERDMRLKAEAILSLLRAQKNWGEYPIILGVKLDPTSKEFLDPKSKIGKWAKDKGIKVQFYITLSYGKGDGGQCITGSMVLFEDNWVKFAEDVVQKKADGSSQETKQQEKKWEKERNDLKQVSQIADPLEGMVKFRYSVAELPSGKVLVREDSHCSVNNRTIILEKQAIVQVFQKDKWETWKDRPAGLTLSGGEETAHYEVVDGYLFRTVIKRGKFDRGCPDPRK